MSTMSNNNNRLTSVEGQRVMAIMDDSVQKFGVVSLLKKEVLQTFPSPSPSLTTPNSTTSPPPLSEDVASFVGLKSAIESLNQAIEKDDYELIEDAGDDVESVTLTICRLMKDRPELLDNLRGLQIKVGNPKNTPALRGFLGIFNELRDLTHQRLGSTVEDERARNFFFADMVSKEKKMSNDLKMLVAQLAEIRIQRERDSTSRKLQLNKLREELRDMHETTINEAKALERETTFREATDSANFTQSENAKNQELQSMQKALEEKTSTNKKKELMLRKKKARVEKELENWIMKYDQDMEEKEAELAILRQDYDRELKELQETEEAYDKLMKEKETFMAEHKRRDAIEKRERSKKRRLNDAAFVIQRAWKNYKSRQKAASPTTKQRKKSPKKGASPKKGRSPSPSKKGAATPKKPGTAKTTKPKDTPTKPKETKPAAKPKPSTPSKK